MTDPHGRMWQVSPATNFQISPSSPGQIWQASCAALMTRAPVLSAHLVAEHNQGRPGMSSPPPFRPEDFEERCETCNAPPGQLCHAWCDTGYTAEDARADAERHDAQRDAKPPAP